ncbi:hypothetical protein POSPLADRAFT_1048493 [Postia placenta MAD-698-R-SB12]|uniref:Uncharacterized protein n=2 Tax=Rhodonia placenta TaxID=104341 RepID=A0A1X6MV31_9APHY|nr:hypothetical protein POSPLADRAFT_1048493 [Postia placenta MAD-698-R-SB12]OSX60072.1 hypothetical protein POSPLADRAFT_1048493 [Postia placenta MAD-698-R-SB12]
MTVMLLTKNVFGYLFSDDEAVVDLVSKVMPFVASFQVNVCVIGPEPPDIADALAGSCGGVLRGQGRQHLGAIFNLVAYYILALPLGITVAFHPRTHMGLKGLWLGQDVALFIIAFGEYAVVWLGTDWDKEVQRSIDRNKEEAKRRRMHEGLEYDDWITTGASSLLTLVLYITVHWQQWYHLARRVYVMLSGTNVNLPHRTLRDNVSILTFGSQFLGTTARVGILRLSDLLPACCYWNTQQQTRYHAFVRTPCTLMAYPKSNEPSSAAFLFHIPEVLLSNVLGIRHGQVEETWVRRSIMTKHRWQPHSQCVVCAVALEAANVRLATCTFASCRRLTQASPFSSPDSVKTLDQARGRWQRRFFCTDVTAHNLIPYNARLGGVCPCASEAKVGNAHQVRACLTSNSLWDFGTVYHGIPARPERSSLFRTEALRGRPFARRLSGAFTLESAAAASTLPDRPPPLLRRVSRVPVSCTVGPGSAERFHAQPGSEKCAFDASKLGPGPGGMCRRRRPCILAAVSCTARGSNVERCPMGRARPIVSPVLCVSRVEGPRGRCTRVTAPGGLVLARTRQGEMCGVRCGAGANRPHRVHARKNIGWPRADALHCTTSESLEDGCEVPSRSPPTGVPELARRPIGQRQANGLRGPVT